ncbi:MAG TPA: MazG family protein [Pseudolysinimonas sp.]|nr:MazG family protein [Pseudolysinimonas sp.]
MTAAPDPAAADPAAPDPATPDAATFDPPASGPAAHHPRLDELIATLERLRAPGGCAWDRDQTHASLVQYLVEETFELVEAIESGTREELIEELGDVLYQVLFHADIEAEAGSFILEDVAEHMTRKMVGRHPHIFGDTVADTPDAVAAQWERIKQVEKAHRTSVLEGIPQAMPALALADKMLGRAAKVGVTPDAAPVPADEAALGGQLLSIVAGARTAGLDAERALRAALRTLARDVEAAERAEAAERPE